MNKLFVIFLLAIGVSSAFALPEHPRQALLRMAEAHPELSPVILDALSAPLTEEVLRSFFEVATVSVSGSDGFQQDIDIDGRKNVAMVDPASIVQIGKELWDVIDDNKPVVNYTIDFAGAVPEGITDWAELEQWLDGQSPEYKFEFKNGIGMKLTEFEWVWGFKYNGNINGTGKYLTEAGPIIKYSYAYLTEHIDVQSKAWNPLNYGTTANPIGGLDLEVDMTSWGEFEKTTVGCHCTIKGDGSFNIVTCDQN